MRSINEAKPGDLVSVSTSDCKNWKMEVDYRLGSILYLKNDKTRMTIGLDGVLTAAWKREDYGAYVETRSPDMIADMIQFSDYNPEDEKAVHILQLIGLHLNKMDDDKKDELSRYLMRLITSNHRILKQKA